MADISIPGIKSRFDTEKTIQNLMDIERIPRNRVEKTVENLQAQKVTWQTLGRKITTLRDGANMLYSYQNPFNDRMAVSSNNLILDATVTREARDQTHDFTVKQLAQPDRFISLPLSKDYKVSAGTYGFSTGEGDFSFKFSGGSLTDFSNALNRRAENKITSSVIAIKAGSASLIINSAAAGAENRLVFKDAAHALAVATGIVADTTASNEPSVINIKAIPAELTDITSGLARQAEEDDSLKVAPQSNTAIKLGNIQPKPGTILHFETAVSASPGMGNALAAEESSETETEENTAPLNALTITFTGGSGVALPAIANTEDWTAYEYDIAELAGGNPVSLLDIQNPSSIHEVSIRNIRLINKPQDTGFAEPLNAISTAQDALIVMDGIEIERSSNAIGDLIPGLTLNVHAVSDVPVSLRVESNNEAVKDAVISFVGNYNRLMAELNVLTRNDERVINELTYLTDDERTELRGRMGTLSGDSSVLKLRADLINIVNDAYQTTNEGAVMFAEFGISTDARRSGTSGYDPSRLRGYLEIDEKALDNAIATRHNALRELMGRDSDGDLIVDSGLAFAATRTLRPFVEVGGIITSKTSGLDLNIAAGNRRIESIDRQLVRKEADLKRQYGQMEDAYNRMERMSNSFDNFSTQNTPRR